MIQCPECDAAIDLDADDVDEGDVISCDECGAELQVVSLDPLEVELYEDEDEEEEDEFLEEDEEEGDLEEDEDEDDDWR
jgi:alpha-aminoadipate carrier protein LysW